VALLAAGLPLLTTGVDRLQEGGCCHFHSYYVTSNTLFWGGVPGGAELYWLPSGTLEQEKDDSKEV
jgi:hypothetical protein